MLSGELPWCQHTHRADDIATAIRLADEFGYRLVINHATEAYLLADVIAERGIPCIVGPLFHTRSKVEVRNRSLATAGKLANAGVTVALTTDHPVVAIDFLVHQATFAVREGMSRDGRAALDHHQPGQHPRLRRPGRLADQGQGRRRGDLVRRPAGRACSAPSGFSSPATRSTATPTVGGVVSNPYRTG